MREPTLFELLKAGVHFGHQTSRWHPRMKPFIFTSRNGIHIIDLEKSLERIRAAQEFLRSVSAKGGTVLFVGTKRQAKEPVKAAAESCGAFFVTERWLGGLCTNFGIVSKLMQRLHTLTSERDTGKLEKYTKKERSQFDEEIARLEKLVGGISGMQRLPDAVVIADIKTEKTALREAKKTGIPIVALADTNTDPADVAYPIPANDDATKSIQLITAYLADAVSEGKMEFEKNRAAAAAESAATDVPEGIVLTAIPKGETA